MDGCINVGVFPSRTQIELQVFSLVTVQLELVGEHPCPNIIIYIYDIPDYHHVPKHLLVILNEMLIGLWQDRINKTTLALKIWALSGYSKFYNHNLQRSPWQSAEAPLMSPGVMMLTYYVLAQISSLKIYCQSLTKQVFWVILHTPQLTVIFQTARLTNTQYCNPISRGSMIYQSRSIIYICST